MAWIVRTLSDASARARGAFRQYMPGTDSALKNNFVTVTAKVLAALSHEFELRMKYLSSQMFLRTATGQFLVMHCADIGIYRKQAAKAAGEITGTGTPNVVYPAGVRFASGNVTYVSTLAAVADATGTVTFAVASEAKGSAQNRDSGGLLALSDPVLWPDLSLQWTVTANGLGGGADIEDDEALRARGLQRKQNPPKGGALSDYERIVRAVPGVLKAWAFRVPLSPGAVVVHFLFAGRPDFIPTAADVAAVQSAIDAERLIRADDSVAVAPIARPIDVTITGLSSDTPDVRAAISVAIRTMFLERCRPGIDGDPFTVSRSWISEAISQAAGEDRHTLTAPSSDIILNGGRFPTLGVVTYGA